MPTCDLCVARIADGYIVRVQGRGTLSHSPALARFVEGCFEREPQNCVAVDLLKCDYLDSTFLGCLLRLQRAGQSRFAVVADEAARKRLLAATRIASHLTLLDTPPRSQSTFIKIGATALTPKEQGRHVMAAHEALSEVPSESSSLFERIASELKRDLDDQDDDCVDLFDTAVLPIQPK